MSTRLNGVTCWYCNSAPDEPCEACDEMNVVLAAIEGLSDAAKRELARELAGGAE